MPHRLTSAMSQLMSKIVLGQIISERKMALLKVLDLLKNGRGVNYSEKNSEHGLHTPGKVVRPCFYA